ncbi:hypothetical protein Htur_3264 [Haloterrigena turkmenica DSM 5511]|uniref:Peptidase M24 domain-containing protein n=1 Tax=Haloterrigena turkmenica (strain ATCC 51198 / DSM 5511 / JCM 9101 / NCIMB 13204 / VKM B-1734 / 4k) TaxID=543526 RepID=D2RZT9_HALTV|nr:M24 family metallopeptidase [Haloterrigena turkmenica]ADB62128.1 hypothetical protein Htur_3264 [Haloterrigena turkmenica DSM 5511]
MTDADSIGESDDASDGDAATEPTGSVADRLESRLAETLERRGAVAFVHVGFPRDPGLRYCQVVLEERSDQSAAEREQPLTAVAFDGDTREWFTATAADASTHPARALASQLADRVAAGTVLTPARLPHDAALYLEEAGFEPASTDVLERARAAKTTAERERIAAAQTAAGAGIRRGAALLADATIEDGHLVADGDAVTPSRLRTAIDEGIVAAGAFPAGNTVVNPDSGHAPSSRDATVAAGSVGGADAADEPLRPAEPIVLETAPRGPGGYHGGLVRTLVVDGDGGRERRAHVGATQSFRSAAAMLTADSESVTAVEADLEAEVRAFGFEDPDAVATRVGGVGLEPRERPLAGGDEIEPGSVVRLESAVRVEGDRWLRIADLLVKGDEGERATYLASPSRSLEPRALLEE